MENYSKLFNKKVIFVALLGLVLVIGSVLFFKYYSSFTSVTVVPSDGMTITVGTSGSEQSNIQNIAIQTNQQITKKVKKGSYQVLYAKDGYQDKTVSIDIKKDTTINSIDLDYTAEHLNQILNSEKTTIHATALASAPAGYSIVKEDIYKRGDWYSAVLIPQGWYRTDLPPNYYPKQTNPNNKQDIYRIILKKEGSKWVVAAGPLIVISIADYPNIPQDIIRKVNNESLI